MCVERGCLKREPRNYKEAVGLLAAAYNYLKQEYPHKLKSGRALEGPDGYYRVMKEELPSFKSFLTNEALPHPGDPK